MRRSALAVTTAAVLASLLSGQQVATAAPLTDSAAVNAFAAGLGPDRTGGVYRDEDGRLVITVTDEATANAVEAAGGVAEVVNYSTAQLRSVHNTLDAKIADVAPIPNTSWGVDPRTNQVVVEIFNGVSAADEKRIVDLVSGYGDAVTVNRLPGEVDTLAYETHGGTGIYSKDAPAHRCTLGFNVRNSAGQKYFLTAGHCAYTADDLWWNREAGGHYLGKRMWHDFGGIEKDFAVMEYRGPDIAAYGAVEAFGTTYDINYSRYPDAGDPVHRAGKISNDLVGEVLSPSETVTVDGGVVLKNMIKTTLCGRHGDSGGPLWNGTGAIGLLSAGTGAANGDPDAPCRSETNGERTWYQPVHWILVHYGLEAF